MLLIIVAGNAYTDETTGEKFNGRKTNTVFFKIMGCLHPGKC